MFRLILLMCAAMSITAIPRLSIAGPISVDGVIGAEWSGATVKHVLFNPTAPTGNFGAPTNENSEVGYDIFTRADAAYVYVGLQTITNYSPGLNFANLYFDTNPGTGSDIGFEVNNERAFLPGVAGSFNYTAAGSDIHFAVTNGSATTPTVLEFATPWSFFKTDPLGMGFPVATNSVQLRLSQSFGYSVAGGATYGADRLGTVVQPTANPVPEPSTAILAFIGLVGPVGASTRSAR